MNILSPKYNIAIVGGGPTGLFAAEYLSSQGYGVHIFDRMPSVGRKFLMAGRSGLNLTHSEPIDHFIKRYGSAQEWLKKSLYAFTPQQLQQWAEKLGQPCFVGSSGRVFPRSMKASPLLRLWINRLKENSVKIYTKHNFVGWNENALQFATPDGIKTYQADATLLALGGASWPRLGSDGQWSSLFKNEVSPFLPTNCGFKTSWSDHFLSQHEGAILHSVELSVNGEKKRGDLTITKRGLEGSAIYALSPRLRDIILTQHCAVLSVDLRPTLPYAQIIQKLKAQRVRESLSNKLRKALSLDKLSRELIKGATTKNSSLEEIASVIKKLPIELIATDHITHAISTAGGLKQSALNESFMIHSMPGVFAAGEMLDWEAPTGGYLLQGCFSTGLAAAKGIRDWLESSN
ncbi:TIGR03862 family flavoprotein [Swingsia samuiensis]|uniref:TIGR03862 family flavoprotein n=1 Tax=Swingsia samuiensis TaxID=1293412 RepID=A0A4Y6UJY3_9PROT|nr:TIGR03862 family flavoprotein [Swingsia samuiensis]QDH17872.1 TIGR03862 family flavoprotein [Swingsia samuiensis]